MDCVQCWPGRCNLGSSLCPLVAVVSQEKAAPGWPQTWRTKGLRGILVKLTTEGGKWHSLGDVTEELCHNSNYKPKVAWGEHSYI